MDDPQVCTVCNQQLRKIWHSVAHDHHVNPRVEVRTCPHNVLAENRFAEPRHDEWHHCEQGWVKREG